MKRLFMGRELDWASGLFEGEGCIGLHRVHGGRYEYPCLQLSTDDEDVARRFHAAVGGLGKVYGPYGPYGNQNRAHWQWAVHRFEPAQAVLAMLWTGLGERRRACAAEVFA